MQGIKKEMNNDSNTVISINSPLEGEWRMLCPFGHHPDAFDFVVSPPNQKNIHNKRLFNFLLGGIKSSDYFCWGKPVFSPVSGTVIRAAGDWKDDLNTSLWKTIIIWYNAKYRFRPQKHNGRLDIRPNAGNHVMIQTDEGFIVLLAHFKCGSTLVKEGQRVEVGEQVGSVGNSGNTTAPHLHINLFDQMDDPYTAKVLPFVFKRYEALNKNNAWERGTLSLPASGSVIKFS